MNRKQCPLFRVMACLLTVGALCTLLTSCRQKNLSEPEQVYVVSAIGFDAEADGSLTVTVEVPLIKEEKSSESEATLFSGTGATVLQAMQEISAGLSRKLIYSHCAIMVLGDRLSQERLEEVFSFAGKGLYLPLAAQVISAPQAKELLSCGALSSAAAGYDIPALLRQESRILGVDFHCEIYSLRSDVQAGRILLPRLLPAAEGASQAVVLDGLCMLQRAKPALLLSRSESVWYALMSDRFSGSSESAGGVLTAALSAPRRYMEASLSDGGLHLTLRLDWHSLRQDHHVPPPEDAAQIAQGAQELFVRMQQEAGQDVFDFGALLAAEQPALWKELQGGYEALFAHASLQVICQKRGETL